MTLCGSSSCGCALVAARATSGDVEGEFPTITIDGSGEIGNAWNVRPSDPWAAVIAGRIEPTNWFAAPLVGGWKAKPGEPPQFRKVGDMVQMRGAVLRNPVSSPTFGTGTTIYILPVGFRPPKLMGFSSETGSATVGAFAVGGAAQTGLQGSVIHAKPAGTYSYLTLIAEFSVMA